MKSPFAQRLRAVTKAIAKSRPEKLYSHLYGAFSIFAGAGDVARASRVLDWMYGPRVPTPKGVVNALSTAAIDGFCVAAQLGDHTRGLPRHERTVATEGPLEDRVREAAAHVFDRITRNAHLGDYPRDDSWQEKDPGDPWRRIDRWRRVQALAREGKTEDAIERLVPYLADLSANDRGVALGNELLLALDIVLKNPSDARAAALCARHGHRFGEESFLIDTALCLPNVATAIAHGLLHDAIGLSEDEREGALVSLEAAIETSLAAVPKKTPKVQRRRVSAEYSQVHLAPATLDSIELAQVHFQKPSDDAAGMSLFPTTVAIGTPTETAYVDAEITITDAALAMLDDDVVQAVAFPLVVRGPIVLTSVSGGDEDPLDIPPSSYAVLARFVAKKAPPAEKRAGLRVFTLRLSFHPKGALDAPKTLRRDPS